MSKVLKPLAIHVFYIGNLEHNNIRQFLNCRMQALPTDVQNSDNSFSPEVEYVFLALKLQTHFFSAGNSPPRIAADFLALALIF